ncbi:MAG TPA: hypothetical protein VHI78_00205 [Bacteroidales bacterium]|jgi:hypothetical protein|nr:hypothetical protein [Bacteroidales bacterium]
MRPVYRNLLIVIAIGLVIGLAALLYTFRKSAVTVGSKKADVEIDAAGLLDAFEADEPKANEIYLGKIVSVTGKVESVSEDSIGISVYLKEDEDIAGIICSFDKSANDVATIDKGNIVEIKGICTGYLMDVILNRCALVSRQTGS